MTSITVKVAAKVNLFLEIIGVLDNGYHELSTIMQSVSLFDYITVSKTEHTGLIEIKTNNSEIPADQTNIAYRAAEAVLRFAGLRQNGISIFIEKNIPIRAGLAGGSADGAGVIVGLNKLFRLELSKDKMIEIAAKIGADIPFCIVGGTVLAKGIGEKLEQLASISSTKNYIVIVKPRDGISTPEAFRQHDIVTGKVTESESEILTAIKQKDLKGIGMQMYNTFEQVVGNADTTKIKKVLMGAGALGAVMTGSGSSVVGLFGSKESAKKAEELLRKDYIDVFMVEAIENGVVEQTEN